MSNSASEAFKSATEEIEKKERKERHNDRFELADQLIEVEDFQDHFLKVSIESNTPDKTATTFWNMICIALFRGNFITSLLQIDSYKNMLRNFKSHKNGLPLVKIRVFGRCNFWKFIGAASVWHTN